LGKQLKNLKGDLDECRRKCSSLDEKILQLIEQNQHLEVKNLQLNATIEDLEKKLIECKFIRRKLEDELKNVRLLVEELKHKNKELKESAERERKIDLLVLRLYISY
jgi:hypothetical protein